MFLLYVVLAALCLRTAAPCLAFLAEVAHFGTLTGEARVQQRWSPRASNLRRHGTDSTHFESPFEGVAASRFVAVFSFSALVLAARRATHRGGARARSREQVSARRGRFTLQLQASQQNAELATKTAIVVGGGVGGLAVAGQLARAGMKVSLFEKNDEVGGRCQSRESTTVKGYRWDTGPSLLLLPAKYADAYKRLGSDVEKELKLKRVDPAYRVVFGDNTHIDVCYDPLKMTEQMEKFEPGCTSNYYRFLSCARRMLDFGVERFVDRQFETWPELVDPVALVPAMLMRGWITLPLLNMLGSMDDLMKGFFNDDRLRALFTFQTLYVGLTPYNSPGALCLLAGTDLTDGVWYPMGGWRGVKDSLQSLAKDHGVEVMTKTGVDKVIVENGRATGIQLESGELREADLVVVNTDLPRAYRTLLREADLGLRPEQTESSSTQTPVKDFAQDWGGKDYSCGVIAFYWALDKKVDYLQHHSVFLGAPAEATKAWEPITAAAAMPRNPNFYVHCPTRTDPSAAPEGGESMMVLFPVGNMQDMAKAGKKPGAKGELYSELRKAARAVILRRFQEMGCGDLAGNIVEEFVRDPEELEELYGLEHGATFGLSHGLLQLAMTRPPPRSAEVDGLFFVGAGTRPGNGVPLVLMGAGLVANQILEDLRGEKQPEARSKVPR